MSGVPDALRADGAAVSGAARRLAAGGLVAFPTETVYGLGANADDVGACRRIYAVKGRPPDNPLIVHFDSIERLAAAVGALPPLGQALARRFWPGPLTLVVARPPGRLEGAAAGLDTVAVRVPSHPVARALLAEAAVPVAAPSANRSGRPSTTTAVSVCEDLARAAAAGIDVSDIVVLDGGGASFGVESTVVDVTGPSARILRLGALGIEDVEGEAGPVAEGGDDHRSPGTRYRHYAPEVPLWLFEADADSAAVVRWIQARGGVAAILATAARAHHIEALCGDLPVRARVRSLGGAHDPDGEDWARDLFSSLRWLDAQGADFALAELPWARRGRLPAVRDRLLRASAGRFVPVENI